MVTLACSKPVSTPTTGPRQGSTVLADPQWSDDRRWKTPPMWRDWPDDSCYWHCGDTTSTTRWVTQPHTGKMMVLSVLVLRRSHLFIKLSYIVILQCSVFHNLWEILHHLTGGSNTTTVDHSRSRLCGLLNFDGLDIIAGHRGHRGCLSPIPTQDRQPQWALGLVMLCACVCNTEASR